MVQTISIVIAAVIHFLFRETIFFNVDPYCCSSLIGFASFFVLAAICMFLSDIELVPLRYSDYSPMMFMILETILSIVFIEFFIVMVWSKVEFCLEFVLGAKTFGGGVLLKIIIVLLSLALLLYSAIATHTIDKMIASFAEHKLMIENHITSIVNQNENNLYSQNVNKCLDKGCRPMRNSTTDRRRSRSVSRKRLDK